MADLHFNVAGTGLNATSLAGRTRTFTTLVDEPEELGGKDAAPNPVEYILLGYAGCLNVVLNLVAKEKGIPINNLRINIGGDINPDRLLGTSNAERAGFKGFDVNVEIDSDASSEELDDLIREAEGRCPVNDTLSNPTPIRLQYVEAGNAGRHQPALAAA